MTFLKVGEAELSLVETVAMSHLLGTDSFVSPVTDLLAEAAVSPEPPTPAEVQELFDEWRYGVGLESVEALKGWLADEGFDLLHVQHWCECMVRRRKALASIPAAEIEAIYSENRPNYERIQLWALPTETVDTAEELATQIRDEGENFHLLAIEHGIDPDLAPQAGYMGYVDRAELPAAAQAALFSVEEGAVVGPLPGATRPTLFLVGKKDVISYEEMEPLIREQLLRERAAKHVVDAGITVNLT